MYIEYSKFLYISIILIFPLIEWHGCLSYLVTYLSSCVKKCDVVLCFIYKMILQLM